MQRPLWIGGLSLWLNLTLLSACGRAELYCAEPVFQAGTVRNGLPLVHRFPFVNRGTEAIEIVEVRSTCGCLTPRLEKRTFGPGEKGELLLEVNTLALAQGTQSWRTRLLCRAGTTTTQELELVIVGDVVTEVLVQPAALTLPADAPGIHEITVTDRRASALTIRAADAGSTCLKTTITAVRREGDVSVQKVHLVVPKDCPEGRHAVALHLYTDDPMYREFTIPVTVIKRPQQRVEASPRQVTFEGDKGQPLPARRVRLSAAEDAVIEVERVDTDHPAVSCTWSNSAAMIQIQVDHTRLTGDLRASIRVQMRKPVVETITIPVLCIVR